MLEDHNCERSDKMILFGQLTPSQEDAMHSEVKSMNLGGVNCYLAKCADGYILMDTGFPTKRDALVRELDKASCKPGSLKLVLITHGDIDHAGNGAFLREKYRAKIGMDANDADIVELGDMSRNRKTKPDKMSLLFRLISLVVGFVSRGGQFDRFKPDIQFEDGFHLSAYGLNANVVHIPGHSKGSIGVLTADGNLYSGDFLYNLPGFNYIDDLETHNQSMDTLRKLNVKMIYPGHGKPISGSKLFL